MGFDNPLENLKGIRVFQLHAPALKVMNTIKIVLNIQMFKELP